MGWGGVGRASRGGGWHGGGGGSAAAAAGACVCCLPSDATAAASSFTAFLDTCYRPATPVRAAAWAAPGVRAPRAPPSPSLARTKTSTLQVSGQYAAMQWRARWTCAVVPVRGAPAPQMCRGGLAGAPTGARAAATCAARQVLQPQVKPAHSFRCWGAAVNLIGGPWLPRLRPPAADLVKALKESGAPIPADLAVRRRAALCC